MAPEYLYRFQETLYTTGLKIYQKKFRAWLLHQDAVTSIIIGAKTMEQLEDNLNAVNIELSAQELGQLDEVSQLPQEYPQWMITRQARARRPGESTEFQQNK